MGMKWKNGVKKILTQALVASLLLAPAVLSPTGTGEGDLPGEVLTGSPSRLLKTGKRPYCTPARFIRA